jgi:uncharacterized protein YjiS (DUF1127 family)
MSTQPSKGTASPAGVSIRGSSQVARIKRVYKVIPVGTSVAASNDRLYQAPKETSAALDAWARRAAAANGFGDAPAAGNAASRFSSYELALKAREAAHAGFGEILAAMAQSLVSQLRAAMESWKRARDTRTTQRALERLDTRTLRDIGFDVSEAPSVAAELAGGAPVTRVRTLMTLHRLSI